MANNAIDPAIGRGCHRVVPCIGRVPKFGSGASQFEYRCHLQVQADRPRRGGGWSPTADRAAGCACRMRQTAQHLGRAR